VLALPIGGMRAFSKRYKKVPQPITEKLTWRALLLQALLALVSIPVIGIGFINMTPFFQGEVTPIRLALVLPILMTLLTLLMLGGTVLAWRKSYWSKGLRIYYTSATAAGILITVLFNYWNLLGCKF